MFISKFIDQTKLGVKFYEILKPKEFKHTSCGPSSMFSIKMKALQLPAKIIHFNYIPMGSIQPLSADINPNETNFLMVAPSTQNLSAEFAKISKHVIYNVPAMRDLKWLTKWAEKRWNNPQWNNLKITWNKTGHWNLWKRYVFQLLWL